MKSLKFSRLRGLSWPQLRDLFRFAARRLDEERLPQVAGSLTFTTILALALGRRLAENAVKLAGA